MTNEDAARPVPRPLRALARMAGRAGGRRKRIQGFVDSVMRGDTVVGWARDLRDPLRRLEIQLLHGEEIVGFGLADLPRKDLIAAEMGDGKYGFRLRLSPQLLDGTSRDLQVCAVTDRGKVPLERGAITVAGTQAPDVAEERSAQSALVGALERLNGRSLHGWAFNPDQPDAPALVDVYDDERYLGSVMADRSRPRLYEKGFPSGARGFVFELPETDGAGLVERLRARVAGTMYDLRRSRDFAVRAAPEESVATTDRKGRAAGAADGPRARSRPARRPALAPTAPPPTALWLAGGDDAAATIADWAEQRAADVRLVRGKEDDALPARFAAADARIEGRRPVELAAREAGFVLFAAAGARIDADVAATVATLPGFPDVVVLTEDRIAAEAARLQSFLAPDRPGLFAVRADLLPGYPGDLVAETEAGQTSPLRLWLAGRADLRWTSVAVPGATAPAEPRGERRGRAWRTVLDREAWTLSDGLPLPNQAPTRLSVALWAGWDTTDLPVLRDIIQASEVPLDLLVPTEGDAALGQARLAAVEALIGDATSARARIVDCAPGALAACAALLAAADGETVLLTDGTAAVPAALLQPLMRWSLHPEVGVVGLAREGEWSTGILIDAHRLRTPSPATGAAAVAHAVSFGLAMIGLRGMAAAGGPLTQLGDVDDAAIEFGLRLARHGFHSVVLDGGSGAAPRQVAGGPLPWPLAARLRAEGLLPG